MVFCLKDLLLITNRLCFSVVLRDRTIDLYCREDQINYWFIGISEEVKKMNPRAYCLSVGKFLWRKLAMMGAAKIGHYLAGEKKKPVLFKTFTHALVAFKRQATLAGQNP
jgi:hypothetical protein